MGYVYRHVRLDKNEPFYIGLSHTNDPLYKRANCKFNRNNFWERIINKTDYRVDILFENDDNDIISKKEIEFIKIYGRIDIKTGTLCNFTDGGEGRTNIVVSNETLKKFSMSSQKFIYYIKNPKNEIEITKNLSDFCKINGLTPQNLQSTIPLKNSHRLAKQHKGFVILKIINLKTKEIIEKPEWEYRGEKVKSLFNIYEVCNTKGKVFKTKDLEKFSKEKNIKNNLYDTIPNKNGKRKSNHCRGYCIISIYNEKTKIFKKFEIPKFNKSTLTTEYILENKNKEIFKVKKLKQFCLEKDLSYTNLCPTYNTKRFSKNFRIIKKN